MALTLSFTFTNICPGGGHADLVVTAGPRTRTLHGLHADEFKNAISDEDLLVCTRVLTKLFVLQLADKSPVHMRAVIAGKTLDLTVTD